jgi:hypothetical protein
MAEEAFRQQHDAMMRWLDPLPPPHCGWLAASELARAAHGEPDTADPALVEAANYIQALAACTTDDERVAVKTRWPAIAAAQQIFECGRPRQWELESWILAGETDDQIGTRCGLSSQTVAAYSVLFFERRSYLDDPEFLSQKLFGPAFCLKFRNDQIGEFWGWVGLCGGPVHLKTFLDTFYAAWRPGEPAVLGIYLQPDTPAPLSMKAMVATHVLPENHDTAVAWISFHLRLMAAEAMPDPRQSEVAFLRLKQDLVR